MADHQRSESTTSLEPFPLHTRRRGPAGGAAAAGVARVLERVVAVARAAAGR